MHKRVAENPFKKIMLNVNCHIEELQHKKVTRGSLFQRVQLGVREGNLARLSAIILMQNRATILCRIIYVLLSAKAVPYFVVYKMSLHVCLYHKIKLKNC